MSDAQRAPRRSGACTPTHCIIPHRGVLYVRIKCCLHDPGFWQGMCRWHVCIGRIRLVWLLDGCSIPPHHLNIAGLVLAREPFHFHMAPGSATDVWGLRHELLRAHTSVAEPGAIWKCNGWRASTRPTMYMWSSGMLHPPIQQPDQQPHKLHTLLLLH